jgi:putative molybdopterin biosynthesis protein
VLGAPGYPVSAALTFDIFAEPLLAELAGAPPRKRPRATARLARKLASPLGMDDWVRVRLGMVGGAMVATPLPRGAGVLTSLVRADGLLVVPAGLEGHHAGEEVGIELLRGLDEIAGTIVAIGSHDLVLDLAASALRAEDPNLTLASSNVGSLGGWWPCATGSATWPARICWTRPPASTRCPTWTGSPASATCQWSGWCTATRA